MGEEIRKYEIALALITKAKETYMSRPNEVFGMCQAFILTIRENQGIRNSVSNLIVRKFGLAKLEEFKKAGSGFDTSAWIKCIIPEFNFISLGGDMSKFGPSEANNIKAYPDTVDDTYWWSKDDKKSRMNAFDYLIHLYRSKMDRLLGL